MSFDFKKLGNEIRLRRKQLSLTQEETARLAECGSVFVNELEKGKATVRLDKLIAVLNVLGMELKIEQREIKP